MDDIFSFPKRSDVSLATHDALLLSAQLTRSETALLLPFLPSIAEYLFRHNLSLALFPASPFPFTQNITLMLEALRDLILSGTDAPDHHHQQQTASYEHKPHEPPTPTSTSSAPLSLSTRELLEILDSHDPETWIDVLLFLLSTNPLLPEPLLQPLLLLTTTTTSPTTPTALRRCLDNLPVAPHLALRSLLEIIRYAPHAAAFLKSLPDARWTNFALILFPSQTPASDVPQKVALLQNLLHHLPAIYRASSSAAAASSLMLPKRFRNPLAEEICARSRKKQHLVMFFQLRDPQLVTYIDPLCSYYKTEDIADGLVGKYCALPRGWKTPELKARYAGQRVCWLKEGTSSPPPINYKRATEFPKREDPVDDVIDELVTQEISTLKILKSFREVFVNEMELMAAKYIGQEYIVHLGLSAEEIQTVFGENLMQVIKASEAVVTALELLTLVKGKVQPPFSRVLILASIFRSVSQILLQSYATYNAFYHVAQKTLMEATKRVQAAASGLERNNPRRSLNFLEVWKEVSETRTVLRKKTIENILHRPVQRFPQYPLFFDRMVKIMDKSGRGESEECKAAKAAREWITGLVSEINGRIERARVLNQRYNL